MRRSSGHPKIDAWKGLIVASDEVGYGAWAGPLVVCAAAGPIGWDDPRIQDSKLFEDERGEREREKLFEQFSVDQRFFTHIVSVPSEAVDRMGVGEALYYAHTTALRTVAKGLYTPPLAVVDGSLPVHRFDLGFDVVALPKGDQLVPECSLASILAKVTRDREMVRLDAEFPGYGFASNKGYGGNAAHEAGLQKLGPCLQHRTSYEPIAKILAERDRAGQLRQAWELLDDEG